MMMRFGHETLLCTDFVYEFRFASFCHENEMIVIFKCTHNKSGMN